MISRISSLVLLIATVCICVKSQALETRDQTSPKLDFTPRRPRLLPFGAVLHPAFWRHPTPPKRPSKLYGLPPLPGDVEETTTTQSPFRLWRMPKITVPPISFVDSYGINTIPELPPQHESKYEGQFAPDGSFIGQQQTRSSYNRPTLLEQLLEAKERLNASTSNIDTHRIRARAAEVDKIEDVIGDYEDDSFYRDPEVDRHVKRVLARKSDKEDEEKSDTPKVVRPSRGRKASRNDAQTGGVGGRANKNGASNVNPRRHIISRERVRVYRKHGTEDRNTNRNSDDKSLIRRPESKAIGHKPDNEAHFVSGTVLVHANAQPTLRVQQPKKIPSHRGFRTASRDRSNQHGFHLPRVVKPLRRDHSRQETFSQNLPSSTRFQTEPSFETVPQNQQPQIAGWQVVQTPSGQTQFIPIQLPPNQIPRHQISPGQSPEGFLSPDQIALSRGGRAEPGPVSVPVPILPNRDQQSQFPQPSSSQSQISQVQLPQGQAQLPQGQGQIQLPPTVQGGQGQGQPAFQLPQVPRDPQVDAWMREIEDYDVAVDLEKQKQIQKKAASLPEQRRGHLSDFDLNLETLRTPYGKYIGPGSKNYVIPQLQVLIPTTTVAPPTTQEAGQFNGFQAFNADPLGLFNPFMLGATQTAVNSPIALPAAADVAAESDQAVHRNTWGLGPYLIQ